MIIGMQNNLQRKLVLENIWKHLLVVVVAASSLPVIRHNFRALGPENINDFLLAISIMIVTVCFANFAFTYRDSDSRSPGIRLLSHGATFLFLLLTALLLLTMSIGIDIAYPAMGPSFFVFSALLYIAVALYDFWDLLRTN